MQPSIEDAAGPRSFEVRTLMTDQLQQQRAKVQEVEKRY
jgi:hypothetical protein